MLDKADLEQIAHLLDEKLDIKLDQKLEPIRKDISDLKVSVAKVDEKIDRIALALDEEHEKLEGRISRIEKHLNLPSYF